MASSTAGTRTPSPPRRNPALAPLALAVVALALVALTGGRALAAGPQPIEPVEKPVESDGPSITLVESSSLIHAGEARTAFGVNGAGLTVAVLDTGLRTTHTDFAGRVVAQANFTADNGGDPANATDGNGHGTNVAGIVCAAAGHTGIAPGANVIPVKVLDNAGGGTWGGVAQGLQWVIDHRTQYNITVVNMSLGDGANYTSPPSDSAGIQSKMQQLRASGVAVCVSAGNAFYTWSSAQGMGYPGICPESVSSGAVYDANIGGYSYSSGAIAYTTARDRITPFSQRLHDSVSGTNRTDIFAPGAALTSAGISSDTASSTMHGTSQASPVTAGVCLLLQSYFLSVTGSMPSVDTLEQLMRDTAVIVNDGDDENDNVVNTGLNFPRVDVYAAMDEVNPLPVIGSLSPTGATAGTGPLALTVRGSGFILESTVLWNGAELATGYVSDTELTATIPAANLAAAGTATVTVVNPAPGGGTSDGLPFAITWPAPVVTSITPASGTNNQTVSVTIGGSNFRAGNTVSLSLAGGDPVCSAAATTVSATELTCALPLTGVAAGVYDVVVTADDDQSGTLASGFTVLAAHTTPPQILTWSSLASHGALGPIGLTMADYGVEPRSSGITKLQVWFSEPLDPATVSPSVVSVLGKRTGNASSRVTATALNVTGDVLTISLTRLVDPDTYTVTISNTVQCAAGHIALAGDRDRVIVSLRGDANRDRRVDYGDVLKVQANVGKPVTLSTAAYDLVNSGAINDPDVACARTNVGHLAP